MRDLVRAVGAAPYHSEQAWTLTFAAVTAYAGLLVLGLPLTYMLSRRQSLAMPLLILVGMIAGGLTIVAFAICFPLLLGAPVRIEDIDAAILLAGAGVGALVAAAFGLIAGVPITSKLR
jgi:hypothetical protein